MPSDQISVDLLHAKDITALSKWLTYFAAEVRKTHPPKTVYALLTGILHHMCTLKPECPNFLDTTN